MPTSSSTRDVRPLSVAGAVGAVVFLALWLGYRTGFGPVLAADDAVLDRLAPHATPGSAWTSTFQAISTIFSPTTWQLLAIGVVLLSAVRRQFPPEAQFAVLGVMLGGLVDQAAKLLADRPRPVQAAVPAFGSSYPSGHALAVTVAVIGTLFWLWPRLSQRARVAATVVAVIAIGLVCFARLALAVHHLSDVLGGVGLGLAWTALAVAIIQSWPVHRPRRADQSAKPSGR